MGQRLTGFTSGQAKLPVIPSKFAFKQSGKGGTWVSELMPHTSKIVDELCLVRSMHTEAINHDPAHTFMNTGSQIYGRPSMGSWITYGLGSEADDLPGFVVLVSHGGGRSDLLKDKLTPKAIVAALDEHIIGQGDAKKAVAVALRNRWRRQQLSP